MMVVYYVGLLAILVETHICLAVFVLTKWP